VHGPIPRAKWIEHNTGRAGAGSLRIATIDASRQKFEPVRKCIATRERGRKRRNSAVGAERAAARAAIAVRRPKLPLIVPNILAPFALSPRARIAATFSTPSSKQNACE